MQSKAFYTDAIEEALSQDMGTDIKIVVQEKTPGFTRITVEIAEVDAEGKIHNPEAAAFARTIWSTDKLRPEDYGAIFIFQGKQYKLVEYSNRRPKFPIVGLRVGDNKRFKFPLNDKVVDQLKIHRNKFNKKQQEEEAQLAAVLNEDDNRRLKESADWS